MSKHTENDITWQGGTYGICMSKQFTPGEEAMVAVCESSQWVVSFLGKKPSVLCVKTHRE